MDNIVLSISIASYNVEQYIEKTVESLTENTKQLSALEIIIVNDGSKDDTSKIAHALQQKYPESIQVIDKENGGYGSTINASLKVARGKYYKLLDGDDWFDPQSINDFINYLTLADADLVISPYFEVRDRNILIDNHSEIKEETAQIDSLNIKNQFFAMHELAVKTQVLRQINEEIAENCFYTDAEYVFYCVSAAETISRFRNPVYCYRLGIDGQSVSIAGIRKHYKDHPVVADRMLSCYQKHLEHGDKTKKEILELCLNNIVYHTFQAYMLLEDPMQHKHELIEFDKSIRERYGDLYYVVNKSRLVRTVRQCKFHFYRLLCRVVLKKFTRE